MTTALTRTGINLWFGGHSTSGLTEVETMTGGVVSTTVMVAETCGDVAGAIRGGHCQGIDTERQRRPCNSTNAVVGGPPAAISSVCTAHRSRSKPPGPRRHRHPTRSLCKWAATPHSTVALAGPMTSGAALRIGINWPRISPPAICGGVDVHVVETREQVRGLRRRINTPTEDDPAIGRNGRREMNRCEVEQHAGTCSGRRRTMNVQPVAGPVRSVKPADEP